VKSDRQEVLDGVREIKAGGGKAAVVEPRSPDREGARELAG
jgi:hypothetical protein